MVPDFLGAQLVAVPDLSGGQVAAVPDFLGKDRCGKRSGEFHDQRCTEYSI